MKKTILSFFGIFMLSIIASLKSFAAGDVADKVSERDISNQYTAKESFTQDGVKYTLYSDLSAEVEKNDQKDVKNKKSYILERKDLKIYKDNMNLKNSVMGEDSNSKKYRVVFNNSSGRFSPLSGNIIVKSSSKLDSIHKIVTIVKEYKILNNYIYIAKLPEGSAISETIQKMNGMGASVEEVKVEVLENLNEPQ
jgi:hypothetical protein